LRMRDMVNITDQVLISSRFLHGPGNPPIHIGCSQIELRDIPSKILIPSLDRNVIHIHPATDFA
jgi:hypothetical protein